MRTLEGSGGRDDVGDWVLCFLFAYVALGLVVLDEGKRIMEFSLKVGSW